MTGDHGSGPAGPALRALIDRQEIHDLQMRYCRAVDRLDEELLRSVYFEDAWDDHGVFNGPIAEFIPWVMQFLAEQFQSQIHAISNMLIELDGDVAHGESYFTGFYRFEKDGKPYTRHSCGRYIDRFERRDGVWKIAKRLVVNDWARVDPLTDSVPPIIPGFRSRQDPVYTKL